MIPFSLLGGPLHRLGRQVGLVRGTNTFPLGLAIGVVLWAVFAVLVVVEGEAAKVFSLTAVGAHVRLLVTIPLYFLCETWLDPRAAAFAAMLGRARVVTASAQSALARDVGRTTRHADSWVADSMCLLVAVTWSASGVHILSSGTTATFPGGDPVVAASWAAEWYVMVCLPIFRFLMLRWLWRLGSWSFFLWRVSRLDLNLVPTHPDGVAGLGYLEVVHAHFVPLILGASAIQSAFMAEDLAAHRTNVAVVYHNVVLTLCINAVLFLGPLLVFMPKLWACRVTGLTEYMELAERYVRGFDTKWVRGGAAPDEPLLGSADIQSLADLSNSVSIVRNMRIAPVSLRLVTQLTTVSVLPLLPLLLFEYPLDELAKKFVERIAGL